MQTIESRNNKMGDSITTSTNAIVGVASKPITGVTISGGAYVLHIFSLISPYITYAALIIGLGASIYSLISNRRQARYWKDKLEEEEKSHKNRSDSNNNGNN